MDNFRKKRREWTKKRACELRENLPRSEKWFIELLSKKGYNLDHFRLESNIYFATKIPDLISKQLKVIIEVDGSIHDTLDCQERDRKNEIIYKGHNYKIIRVKAYDFNSFDKCLKELKRLKSITNIPKKVKSKPFNNVNKISCNVKGCNTKVNLRIVENEGKNYHLCKRCLKIYTFRYGK